MPAAAGATRLTLTAAEPVSAEDDRIVAEHRAVCERHVVSGSNRGNCSKYDVLACALKDALIELDKLTKEKAEVEGRATSVRSRYAVAIRKAEAANEALTNVVKDAIHGGPKRGA